MRGIKSFARRVAKGLSFSQKKIIDDNNLGLTNLDIPKKLLNKRCFLEIGFGMGEHFLEQSRMNPDVFFIGSEPYLNGAANVLAKIDDASRFLVWSDDVDLILDKIPYSSVEKIFILFPDPWPKKKHIKRRLLNKERMIKFHNILVKGGVVHFATDIDSYANQLLTLVCDLEIFSLLDKDSLVPHDGYIKTKFHLKAEAEGRAAKFFTLVSL